MARVLVPAGARLADELFLIAHDERGNTPVDPRAVELGLAAALLGELVLVERITIHHGQLSVVDCTPPDDALAHVVLEQFVAERRYRQIRVWLALLAGYAVDAVGERLERAGVVSRTQKRWGRLTRYLPFDLDDAARSTHRLGLLLGRGEPLPTGDALLACLVTATGLMLLFADNSPSCQKYLASLGGSLPPSLRELVAELEAAVDNAMAGRDSHRRLH